MGLVSKKETTTASLFIDVPGLVISCQAYLVSAGKKLRPERPMEFD